MTKIEDTNILYRYAVTPTYLQLSVVNTLYFQTAWVRCPVGFYVGK